MSKIFQRSRKYVSKHLAYTFGLTFILGLILIVFNFGNHNSDKLRNILNDIVNNSKAFSLAFNINSSDSMLPNLCIVARIYGAQISYFPVFALALRHAGLNNIRIYVTNTDNRTNIRQLEETIEFINRLVVRMDYVTFLNLGAPCIENSFGYCMTDRVLKYLYKQYKQSPSICQYVVFTNADNFYSRTFGTRILPYMKANKDIIAWGFVSHHHKEHYKELINNEESSVPQIIDEGTEKCTPVELRAGYADLGSVAYRLEFLHEHNLYFRSPSGIYGFGSDGYFVERAAVLTDASVILRQTLFVHQ